MKAMALSAWTMRRFRSSCRSPQPPPRSSAGFERTLARLLHRKLRTKSNAYERRKNLEARDGLFAVHAATRNFPRAERVSPRRSLRSAPTQKTGNFLAKAEKFVLHLFRAPRRRVSPVEEDSTQGVVD